MFESGTRIYIAVSHRNVRLCQYVEDTITYLTVIETLKTWGHNVKDYLVRIFTDAIKGIKDYTLTRHGCLPWCNEGTKSVKTAKKEKTLNLIPLVVSKMEVVECLQID